MTNLLKEFKEFAMKGNVFDLAVGVIIGGAFGKIVSSFVNDIIMPLLSLLTNGNNISEFEIVLGGGDNPAVLKYGAFLQSIIDFLLIAAAIFVFIKIVSGFKKKIESLSAETEASQEDPVEDQDEPEVSRQEQLLEEIRDLLKNQQIGT